MTEDKPQDTDPASGDQPAEKLDPTPSGEEAAQGAPADKTAMDKPAVDKPAVDQPAGNKSSGTSDSSAGAFPSTAWGSDRLGRLWWRDLLAALGFFTRLPVRAPAIPLAEAARAFPLVGAVVGVVGLLAYLFALRLGLSVMLAAVLSVAATAIVTGALHEDGLADLADMLGVRGDRERKLAVMRDSTIGSYGVLTLVIASLFKIGALADLGVVPQVASALISAHVLSRAVLPVVMRSLPLARPNGLAVHAGKPPADGMYWALGLGIVIVLLVGGPGAAIVATVSALVTAFLVAKLAERHIGGYTGDVLGAIEQVVEIAVLINFVTFS